jgi:membrane-associated phospholipid phosphatase
MDIQQLEIYTALRCAPHYDYGVFTRFLVICQFFPLYLSIGMYAVTLTYKYQELYYRCFSLGLTLNWLLNWALQYVFMSKPHIQGCGDGYSMPSWHSQHAFFFYTMVTTYVLFKKQRLGAVNLVFLNAMPALVCAARLMLGFNTFSELMVGNIVGVTFAFVYQLFLLKVVQPRVPWLLEFTLFKFLGYKDHFFFTNSDNEKLPTSSKCGDEHYVGETCYLCQYDSPHKLHL